MKHELLAPVGNMESLIQAIHNGADAVYLGLKKFGARHYAKNFEQEEIIDAIKLCHLYGVKIYITMNTLVKECEVEEFLNQVLFLHKNGVDAIIMQDFGMISLVRKMYPNLEIHASTQANNSNIETIQMFHDMGVKRVVLARELSLDEIKKIDIPIELEVFIHGALCISYSGNCLMSSMIGERSANRGECTGCCRLPYSLLDNKKVIKEKEYLLSTKEFNSSNKFDELLNSNITSFKIEGRMKSPEYVGFVTKLYRNLIDKKHINLEEELEQLKTLYNRGFTTGNLFNTTDLLNTKTPNHIGVKIGKVIEITKNKIKIKLSKKLNQEDGIRFLESGKGLICNYLYDEKNKLVSNSDSIVYIDNKVDLKTYDTVYKTQDQQLLKKLRQIPLKKIPINIEVIAKENKKLKIVFDDGENRLIQEGNIVEKAITSEISADRIKMQLEKLGNTPFTAKNISVNLDSSIFISIKELNELRRKLAEELKNIRENKKIEVIENKTSFEKLESINLKKLTTATIISEEHLLACLQLKMDRIYVKDYQLYLKYKDNKEVYLYRERNLFKQNSIINNTLVSEISSFDKSKNIIGNYFLNITNSYTAYYLLKNGIKDFCLSVELKDHEIEELLENFKHRFHFNLVPEVLVYGRVENMMIKGNILNITNTKKRYQLKDAKARIFEVYLDDNNTYILNYNPLREIKKISNQYSMRFDFYEEDSNQIIEIVKKYQQG